MLINRKLHLTNNQYLLVYLFLHMIRPYIFILLFVLSIPLNGQDPAKEYLDYIEISKPEYLDSLYLELYFIYKNNDPELAMQYAEKSIAYAERFNHFEKISEAYFAKGTLYWKKYDYKLAEDNFNISLNYALKNNLDLRTLIAYANLGIVNFDKADYDKAIDFNLKSLRYAQKLKNISAQASIYNNIGLIHYRLGDYGEALNNYLLCLEIKQQNDISDQILLNFNNIGLCYNGLNEYDKSKEYFQYVIDNCDECPDNYIIDSNYGLGKAYYGLKNYDKALEYFTISNDMAKQANHTQTIAYSHLYIARIQFKLKKYSLSLKHLKDSEKLSEKYNLIQNQRDNYQLYSGIYQEIGNYKKALDYNNKYISLKDSIMSEGLIQNLKDIYVDFQKSQSDDIIAGKDNVIQRSNQFMIMLGVILILMIIILFFAYRSLTLRSRLNKKLDGMVQVKTKELSSTNIQLVKSRNELDSFLYRTSHDIRGPIATLLGLTSLAKLEAKDNLMSSYLDKINITAEKLNEIISRLTNVSQINSQPLDIKDINLFHTINEVVDDLKPDCKGISFKLAGPPPNRIKTDKILFKIILENLLENSFKFSDTVENTPFVELDIRQNGNLEFTVTDNGVGIEPEYKDKIFDLFFVAHEKDRGSGIGLYQTMLATQKLKGSVELIKNKKPTQFKVTFPDSSHEITPPDELENQVPLENL